MKKYLVLWEALLFMSPCKDRDYERAEYMYKKILKYYKITKKENKKWIKN